MLNNADKILKKIFPNGLSVITLDRIKTVIIFALLASAILLIFKSGLLSIIQSDDSESDTSVGQTVQISLDGKTLKPAGPYVVSITNSSGLHCGYVYDAEEVKSAYENFSAYLGEAMGTAGEPEKITETEWIESLGLEGIYLDYVYDREISCFANSLGINMESSAKDDDIRRLCLVIENDQVYLEYLKTQNNTYEKCTCAVSATSLLSKINEYQPNGASFLYETENDYPLVDKYFMLTEGQPKVPSIAMQKPLLDDTFITGMMDLLGMNSYLVSNYSENGGQVYVDESCTLRVGADGNVSFHNAEELELNDQPLLESSQIISKGDQIANATIGNFCGEASVILTDVEYDDSENSYTLDYNYQIDGYIVSMGQDYALEITIVDGIVIDAEFNFRDYDYSGEEDLPLLGNQAAALVQAVGGGMPVLGYSDNGTGITAEWIIIR